MQASEATLILFTTHLATQNISHSTINVYLSAVQHMHISAGVHNFFNEKEQLTPCLQLTIKRIQKSQASAKPSRIRLPITLKIMGDIKALLSEQPHSYTSIMIWAACCIAFFGFLLVSEFTIPANDQYDESCHLSFNSISVDNRSNPQQLRISIKQSKTDPFSKYVDIFLRTTGDSVCPVKGILPYLAIRGDHKGPLFILQNGRYLTRQHFSSALEGLLKQLHINTHCYNTHSFWIGVATTARQANVQDSLINMMGSWKSDAYLSYIRTPPQELAKVSKYLTLGYP